MATNSGRITYQLIHSESGIVVANRLSKADSWWTRGIGLLTAASLSPDDALWLTGVRSVHTFGMRIALDLLFLDGEGLCTGWMPNVSPGKVARGSTGTCDVVELAEGTLKRVTMLRLGDRFAMVAP